MGIDDRDDYRSHGQAPRRRGAYEGSDPSAGRSYQRGRSRDYDDQAPSRSSSRRDYARDDDPRSGSGSRYERGGSGGYDRRPRNEPSGASRRPRNDGDDDTSMRRDRRGPDQYSRGGTARGPRAPMRDEWDTAARPRGGPRNPAPGDSGARYRRGGAAVAPARGGGLWGDEAMGATGMRRGMVDPRDPRARRGQVAEEEESSGAAGFGKALIAIVLALAIGAGAAYGYYMFSTPKAPPSTGSPTSGSSGSLGVSHTISASHPQPLTLANEVARSFDLVVAG